VFSALLVLSDASSFFLIVVALYVAWVSFVWGLFSVRTLFFFCERQRGRGGKASKQESSIGGCKFIGEGLGRESQGEKGRAADSHPKFLSANKNTGH
jgi:hypothetical protein